VQLAYALAFALGVARCSPFGPDLTQALDDADAGEGADGSADVIVGPDGGDEDAGDCTLLFADDFAPAKVYDVAPVADAGLSLDGSLLASAESIGPGEYRAHVAKTFTVDPAVRSLRLAYEMRAVFDKGSGSPGCRLLLRSLNGVEVTYKLTYADLELKDDLDLAASSGPTQRTLTPATGEFGRRAVSVVLRVDPMNDVYATLAMMGLPAAAAAEYGPAKLGSPPVAATLTCGIFAFSGAIGSSMEVEVDNLRLEACK
jgi:hypothetical protein